MDLVMSGGFADIVRKVFENGEPIALTEIYEIISKDPDVKVEPVNLKHRVRSAIYSLQQSKEVVRVGGTMYKKADKKKVNN